jgi:uncharacterized protein YceH (UPF0502 family)
MASGHGSRALKYRHLAEEALSLGREELAVLAVLLLRGPQTPGELKARCERMASFGSLGEIERALQTLIDRGYAQRVPRRPGQKEDRFEQLLGGERPETSSESGQGLEVPSEPAPSSGPTVDALATRLEALEEQVAELRRELAELRVGALD